MAQEHVSRGDRLFVEEDFAGAVDAYSEALKVDPGNARVFEARANAHIKLEQYAEANEDATKALELDPSLARAYLRKGVALFNMEEYEAAKESFEAGCQLSPDNTFKTWIRKCDAELEDEEASQPKATKSDAAAAAAAAATAAAPATAPAPQAVLAPSPAPTASVPASAPEPQAAQAPAPQQPQQPQHPPMNAPLAPAAAAALTFEGKYRHQHYQLQSKVTVDVYAKKLKKEQVTCEFRETHLTVTIRDLEGNEEYKLDVELYGKVVPEQCKYEVLSTKVEITLAKADTLQWPTLEKSNKVAAANYSTPGTDAPAQYPTSAVRKAKDWSKVDQELAELESKGELDMGDPLNNFFKKIFASGDEDTRRAMMKSFVESNGTVLSTNWSEVGKKKVDCTPPDGMEVRKWES